jgi:hypothetical protein
VSRATSAVPHRSSARIPEPPVSQQRARPRLLGNGTGRWKMLAEQLPALHTARSYFAGIAGIDNGERAWAFDFLTDAVADELMKSVQGRPRSAWPDEQTIMGVFRTQAVRLDKEATKGIAALEKLIARGRAARGAS